MDTNIYLEFYNLLYSGTTEQVRGFIEEYEPNLDIIFNNNVFIAVKN